jgi:hypothetical protein
VNEDLDRALCRDFPNLYQAEPGFDVGDGWEPLIRRLSERLSALIAALPEDERGPFYVVQAKQKFGSLRYYMACETDEMTAAIRDAERESVRTCETCGEPGTRRTKGGWMTVACDEHA